jgi:ubiquitin-conjugating enzyme E2 Z
MSNPNLARLFRDIHQIIKYPLCDNGIYYAHDETDFTKGYAMIVGQPNTPYFGGYYLFELVYPANYPFSPPKVTFFTNKDNIRFHPNFYQNGKVCISLLNTWKGEQWTSCQTISSVLLTLCSVFGENPFLNEPVSQQIHQNNVQSYNELIEYANLDIAVCDVLLLKLQLSVPFYDHFYSTMRELFVKHFDQFIKFVEMKQTHAEESETPNKKVYTPYYEMVGILDFNQLTQKLRQTKELCG